MDIVGILVWLIIGAIAGWLAGKVMRGGGFGLLGNIIVGIVGSFIGGFIGSLIGVGATLTTFSVPGLLMSLLGAIVLLGIANMVQRGRVR